MEEEKVKVTYRGKMCEATKRGGNYSFVLPYSGSLSAKISNSQDGWRLMCSDSEQPDYFFWINYRNDGYMEYANDLMDRKEMSSGVYNPYYSNMGNIDEPAKELFCIAKQLEGYEKLGVAPIEVLELRYRMMGMALKMLGYESIGQVLNGEPNPDCSVIDLNSAVKFIEKYPAFSQYVSKAGFSKYPTVEVTVPDDLDKENFLEEFNRAKKLLEEAEATYDGRDEFLNRQVRDGFIKPDFGLDMKKKMSSADWKSYSEKVKELGKLILRVNADLLAPAEKMRVVQATSLDKFGMEQEVSKITMGAEMDEALDAESYFFIEEVEAFEEKVAKDLSDDRTRNSTPGNTMKLFLEELQEEVDDRRMGIERRDYMRNVYPYEKDPEKRQEALEKYYGIKKNGSQDPKNKKDDGMEPGE